MSRPVPELDSKTIAHLRRHTSAGSSKRAAMFEKAIAGVLTHALGAYVEDLNGEQLRFGLLSGHIQLRDLRLRASAFESLRLPIELVSGSIGELDVRVSVPWSALWSSWLDSDISVEVVVRNVRVELAARWDVSQVRAMVFDIDIVVHM